MYGSRRQPTGLTALISVPVPHSATNPYIVMMARAVEDEPGVDVLFFTWRTALLRRYDVFHTQWPELLFAGPVSLRSCVRQFLFVLLMTKLWLLRIPMVRTLHNVKPHERQKWVEGVLIRWADRRTIGWIRLNPSTVPPPGRLGADVSTILHGHYRDWFARYQKRAATTGSVLFAGHIRVYKNVPQLIAAFRDIPGSDRALRIVGRPTDATAQRELVQQAAGDERISFLFGHVTDEQLVREVSSAALVVLPYADMHNSGAALLALSLDRPILVPDNEVTAALAAEVGEDWVHRFDGRLRAADVQDALERPQRVSAQPDLSGRGWQTVGAEHVAAYRRAIDAVHRR